MEFPGAPHGIARARASAGRRLLCGRHGAHFDLQAEQDPVAPRRFAGVLKSLLGGRVTIVVIPNASHALFPEQPHAVAQAIAIFARRAFTECDYFWCVHPFGAACHVVKEAKQPTYQCFFALALCSATVQEIKRVNALAFRAMSDVFNSLLASAV